MEVLDKRRFDEAGEAKQPEPAFTRLLSGVTPAFDRVLIKILPKEKTGTIVSPDAYDEPSQYGVVVAKGQGVYVGGCVLSIPFNVGDTVRFSLVNLESLPNEFADTNAEDKFGFIRAQDVRCYWEKR